MIVAVTVVHVVQVPADDVVRVIAVRDGFVAAPEPMGVAIVVAGAGVCGGARRRVLAADGERVLIDVVSVDMVEMPVVEVVLVTFVLDGSVPAAGAVNVVVLGVGLVLAAHAVLSSGRFALVGSLVVLVVRRWLRGVLDGTVDEVAHVRVRQRIEDVLAGAPARDDSFCAEEPQLLRHRREPHARRLRELRHAPLAIAEAMEKLEARDVSCRAEDGRRALELLVAHDRVADPPRVLLRTAHLGARRGSVGLVRGRTDHYFTIS
jgi:hypothetical protein